MKITIAVWVIGMLVLTSHDLGRHDQAGCPGLMFGAPLIYIWWPVALIAVYSGAGPSEEEAKKNINDICEI